MKKARLDAEAVLKAAKRGEISALKRCGAYIRGAAQRSIKTRKMPSTPGQAPNQRPAGYDRGHWHAPDGTFKRSIRFLVDGKNLSVDIGTAFGSNSKAARTLEHGGEVEYSFKEIYRDLQDNGPKTAFNAFKKKLKDKHVSKFDFIKKRKRKQAARPFMKPALDGFVSQAAKQFKNLF